MNPTYWIFFLKLLTHNIIILKTLSSSSWFLHLTAENPFHNLIIVNHSFISLNFIFRLIFLLLHPLARLPDIVNTYKHVICVSSKDYVTVYEFQQLLTKYLKQCVLLAEFITKLISNIGGRNVSFAHPSIKSLKFIFL